MTTLKFYNKINTEEVTQNKYIALQRIIKNKKKVQKSKGRRENMEEIKEKANYCLNCKIKPCSLKGCPLENNIPDFIKAVKETSI